MINTLIVFMVAGAAQIGDASTSTAPASTPAAVTAPAKGSDKDPNKQVCRNIVPTGERLGGVRVCHTRAEWESIGRDARDQTSSMQAHGGQGGVPGN